jgi:hypothetical protein
MLDKKYTIQNAVLTEEILDEPAARLNICLADPWHDYLNRHRLQKQQCHGEGSAVLTLALNGDE